MLLGREIKLFPHRFKRAKEDKLPISLGIDERSQSQRSKYIKECRLDKEGNNKPTELELVGRE